MGAVGEITELAVVVVDSLAPVVGKSRHQEGIRQGLAARHLQWIPIAPGAEAEPTAVALIEARSGNGPQQWLAMAQQADGAGKEGKAMGVIGGAIEWIHAPLQLAVAPGLMPAFFG